MSMSIDTPFNMFQKNIHSQNGEDGVIEELLSRLSLEPEDNWCVEFGAWDGVHLSNTFALVEKGWKAVYLEGDPSRFNDLLKLVQVYPMIVPINEFVAHRCNVENSLDNLLARTIIPNEFAILSIDIDSYDLDVWESLINYSPKILILEINSSVPPGIIWRHSKKTPGNTFSAALNVSMFKGYTLVCHTGNLIFVRNDLVSKLDMELHYINFPETLFLFDSPWICSDLYLQKPNMILLSFTKFIRSIVLKLKSICFIKNNG